MVSIGQVRAARLLSRSIVKQAFELENTLDGILETQTGDMAGLNSALETLATLVGAARGSLVDQSPEVLATPVT